LGVKVRADQLVVARGLAESRTRAQALILAGNVFVGERRVGKAGDLLAEDAELSVKGRDHPWVSRGGIKLDHGLAHFGFDVTGAVALDVGSSTGGFTDVLLSRGAAKVYAVDVGTNQLAWKLRSDPRVESREGVNARFLKPEDFEEKFDLATIDVAFISATMILPAVVPLMKQGGSIITLIKPQFEVGKGEVGKGGIVKDPEQHQQVIDKVNSCARTLGLNVRGVIDSPIHGADGNREFLALYG